MNFENVTRRTGGAWLHIPDPSKVTEAQLIIDVFSHKVLSTQPPFNLTALAGDGWVKLSFNVKDASKIESFSFEYKNCETAPAINPLDPPSLQRQPSLTERNWVSCPGAGFIAGTDISGQPAYSVDILNLTDGIYIFRVSFTLKGGGQSSKSCASNPVRIQSLNAMMEMLQRMMAGFGGGGPPLPPAPGR